jgi:hypothetical protein
LFFLAVTSSSVAVITAPSSPGTKLGRSGRKHRQIHSPRRDAAPYSVDARCWGYGIQIAGCPRGCRARIPSVPG